MDNLIEQFAIGELLDGRYFYIPAYQRGYRWTEKQVGDLLRDLLCFALNDQKKDFDFYCLQPIIARAITDEQKVAELFGEELKASVIEKGAWEIIDGQQRLTTIFLIYRYLLKKLNLDAETLKQDYDGKEEYHICYATRKGSASFLENLSLDSIRAEDSTDADKDNIDFFHMGQAFKFVESWIETDGKEINKRHGLGGSLPAIRSALFELLNGDRSNKRGSVQVLWYQISEESQSSIKEFQKINTGKIKLTDAELIKGLFLMNRDYGKGDSAYISELALDWEFIENTLHKDSFWYFLQMRGSDMPNRIDLLFNLLYKMSRMKDVPEEDWPTKLQDVDVDLNDPSKSVIFRFYYDRFDGIDKDHIFDAVKAAWEEVMSLFRMLDDWYATPMLYNYIGLLSQCGEDLTCIILHYMNMPEDSTRSDFSDYLVGRIRQHLSGTEIDYGNNTILTPYKNHHDLIFNILLTLNIHILNLQNSKFESESNIYKFPFDVLNEQGWDIEHIDSFHTNALKKDDKKIEWIDTALADLSGLSDEDRQKVSSWKEAKKYAEAISFLKEKAGEESDVSDEVKNRIGNLTLLDSSTNRSYGNSLFCTKRRVIIERMQKGVFVPFGTQYIFYKFFDKTGTNRSQWTQDDMSKYQNYIFEMLRDYLPKEGNN